MIKRIVTLLLVVLLIFVIVSCTEEPQADPDPNNGEPNPNESVKKLLPIETGYEWVYFGIAEYAHRMTLEEIEQEANEDEISYYISGEVEDVSSGESGIDFSIELEYEIEDGQLTQEADAEAMMDTNFEEIILIKTPLEQGTFWEQTVVDEDGNEMVLDCKIREVTEEQGINTYTVLYKDQDSDWYEKRKIKEGIGVIEYQRLIETGGAQVEISYVLHEPSSVIDDGKTD